MELQYRTLREWQSSCLIHVNYQGHRKICWYYDEEGGIGKTWFAHYLHYCFQYDLFDGVTSARDITSMITVKPVGFVFDVTRSDASHFSYNTLETVKNGFIMTGRYTSIKRLFLPVPVIVFFRSGHISPLS